MPACFTELLPATKTERHRCYRWAPVEGRSLWCVGELVIESERGSTAYEVDETASDRGRSFTLRKLGGSGFHCVDVRGWGADTCSCRGFEFARTCRHLECVRSLIRHEQL